MDGPALDKIQYIALVVNCVIADVGLQVFPNDRDRKSLLSVRQVCFLASANGM